MAINNFLQWNPSAANQESDLTYLADSQRVGGATDPSIFDAALANKLFYQLSTGMTALMQMMAYKGFPVSDASLGTLAAQLANILTTADLRGYAGLQTVPYASSVVLNAGQYLSWQIALNGNMMITVAGALPGDTLSIVFVNDSVGSHTVTWSAPFESAGTEQPSAIVSATSVLTFKVRLDGSIYPQGPVMTNSGALGGIVNTSITNGNIDSATITNGLMDSTPVGSHVPSSGVFTYCTANTQLQGPTVAATNNSTNAATTAWAKYGLSMSLGANGYVGLPTWLGGWMIQWGVSSAPDIGSGPALGVSFNGVGFPTQCFGVMATMNNNVGSNIRTIQAVVTSRSAFNIGSNGGGTTAFWFAVGN